MKKMRKAAALLAALALLFGAIGCSDGDSGESGYDDNPPITGDEDPTQPPITSDKDPSQFPATGGDDTTLPPIQGGDVTQQPQTPEDDYNPGEWEIKDDGTLVKYSGADINVTIPKSVTKIDEYVFQYKRIESVKISEGVTDIGKRAFDGCSNLKTITFPSSLKNIDYGAFNECTALEKVDIPEGVEVIGQGAFNRCSGLKTVSLPVSLTDIGLYAFNECSSLVSVTYAGTLVQWRNILIGQYMFVDAGVMTITGKDGVIINVK